MFGARFFHASALVAKATKKETMKELMSDVKRPATSYALFMKDRFAQFKDEFPGLKFTDISAKVREKWLSMSESEKKHYVDASTKAREEYAKLKKLASDQLGPKRPATAYIRYYQDVYHTMEPSIPHERKVSMIADQWRTLPLSKKQAYIEKYREAMIEWEARYGKSKSE